MKRLTKNAATKLPPFGEYRRMHLPSPLTRQVATEEEIIERTIRQDQPQPSEPDKPAKEGKDK